MQPPVGGIPPFDPAGPPCNPYPNQILILGNYRWMDQSGRVIVLPDSERTWANSTAEDAIEDGEDPQEVVGGIFGEPTTVNARTREFWEAAAARGGHTLMDLMD